MSVALDAVVGAGHSWTNLESVIDAAPPAAAENQIQYQSFILHSLLDQVLGFSAISSIVEPHTTSNICKLGNMVVDKTVQGTFINGAEKAYFFLSTIIANYLQSCSDIPRRDSEHFQVNVLRQPLHRFFIHRLARLAAMSDKSDISQIQSLEVLKKFDNALAEILASGPVDTDFLRCVFHHFARLLNHPDKTVQKNCQKVHFVSTLLIVFSYGKRSLRQKGKRFSRFFGIVGATSRR